MSFSVRPLAAQQKQAAHSQQCERTRLGHGLRGYLDIDPLRLAAFGNDFDRHFQWAIRLRDGEVRFNGLRLRRGILATQQPRRQRWRRE